MRVVKNGEGVFALSFVVELTGRNGVKRIVAAAVVVLCGLARWHDFASAT